MLYYVGPAFQAGPPPGNTTCGSPETDLQGESSSHLAWDSELGPKHSQRVVALTIHQALEARTIQRWGPWVTQILQIVSLGQSTLLMSVPSASSATLSAGSSISCGLSRSWPTASYCPGCPSTCPCPGFFPFPHRKSLHPPNLSSLQGFSLGLAAVQTTLLLALWPWWDLCC